MENKNLYYDIILHLEETFPFRPKGFIDKMIENFLLKGLNTLIATKVEPKPIWHEKAHDSFVRIDKGDIPREFKEKILVGLPGLGLITYPELIRKQNIFKSKVGFFETKIPTASIEVRNKEEMSLVNKLLKN